MSNSTVKIRAITKDDELLYYLRKVDEAALLMVNNPSPETRMAFEKANKKYFEVSDAYRIASRLLMEKARRSENRVFTQASF